MTSVRWPNDEAIASRANFSTSHRPCPRRRPSAGERRGRRCAHQSGAHRAMQARRRRRSFRFCRPRMAIKRHRLQKTRRMHANSPRTRHKSRRTKQWRVHCKRHGQKKGVCPLQGRQMRQRRIPMGCRPRRIMRPWWRLPARRPRTKRLPQMHRPRIPSVH